MASLKQTVVTPGLGKAIADFHSLSKAQQKVFTEATGLNRTVKRGQTPMKGLVKAARELIVGFVGANIAASAIQKTWGIIKADVQETIRIQKKASESQKTFDQALGSFAFSNLGVGLDLKRLSTFRDAAIEHGAEAGEHGPQKIIKGFELARPQLSDKLFSDKELQDAGGIAAQALKINPEIDVGGFLVTSGRIAEKFGESMEQGANRLLAIVSKSGSTFNRLADYLSRALTVTSNDPESNSYLIDPNALLASLAFTTAKLGDKSTERTTTAEVEFNTTFPTRTKPVSYGGVEVPLRGKPHEKVDNFFEDIQQFSREIQQGLLIDAAVGGGGTGTKQGLFAKSDNYEEYKRFKAEVADIHTGNVNGKNVVERISENKIAVNPQSALIEENKLRRGTATASFLTFSEGDKELVAQNITATREAFGLSTQMEDIFGDVRKAIQRVAPNTSSGDFKKREMQNLLKISRNKLLPTNHFPTFTAGVGAQPYISAEHLERLESAEEDYRKKQELQPFIDAGDQQGFLRRAGELDILSSRSGISPIEGQILLQLQKDGLVTPDENRELQRLNPLERTPETLAAIRAILNAIFQRISAANDHAEIDSLNVVRRMAGVPEDTRIDDEFDADFATAYPPQAPDANPVPTGEDIFEADSLNVVRRTAGVPEDTRIDDEFDAQFRQSYPPADSAAALLTATQAQTLAIQTQTTAIQEQTAAITTAIARNSRQPPGTAGTPLPLPHNPPHDLDYS